VINRLSAASNNYLSAVTNPTLLLPLSWGNSVIKVIESPGANSQGNFYLNELCVMKFENCEIVFSAYT
jgi:hypothetical protein